VTPYKTEGELMKQSKNLLKKIADMPIMEIFKKEKTTTRKTGDILINRTPFIINGEMIKKANTINRNTLNENVLSNTYTEDDFDAVFALLVQKLKINTEILLVHSNNIRNAAGVINFSSENEGYYCLNISSQKYIGKERNDADDIEIGNTICHELSHAKTRENMQEDVLLRLKENKKSWAYWAYRVIDEYRAYKLANELYPQEKDVLKSTEAEIIHVIKHYSCPHTNTGYSDEAYIDSYYDLASAIIAHNIVNPEFPSSTSESFNRFAKTFMEIIVTAALKDNMTYHDYKKVGQELRDSFKLITKDQTPAMQKAVFANFCKNSHMMDI